MRYLAAVCLILMLFFTASAYAQDQPSKFGVFGLGSSNGSLIGWAALSIPVADRIMSFTSYDAGAVIDPTTGQFDIFGKQLQYSAHQAFAYKIYDIAKGVTLWGLGSAGIAASDRALVGSFEYGGFVDYMVKGRWGILAVLCAERNAVTGTKFAPRFGVRAKL